MARPTRVCHWTQAVHVAVHQLLTDVAALRTDEGKPWGIARLAAELLREIDAKEAARAREDGGETTP
jgi:hypothetical protein